MRREFAQGLAHQPGLQTRQAVAHFAFKFGFGRERGHRIDHDQVYRPRAHQAVDDFQRLFARVGLADQQVLQVDTEFLGVLDVQGMLGIDERALPALFLHFGDDLQGERGLAGGFRAVDFNHPPARQAAYAERDIQPERTGGDHLNVLNHLALAQAHDGALAKLFFDLSQGHLQGLGFFAVDGAGCFKCCFHEKLLKYQCVEEN